MDKKTSYNASSISWEQGSEAHRNNPSRYLYSSDIRGIRNQLIEIVDNAVDEIIRYSHENQMTEYAKMYLEIKPDDTVIVQDLGGGMPCENHPKFGMPTVYILCEQDSAGGKGRNTEGYDTTTAGVNGAGLAVAKSCATYFNLDISSLSADGRYTLSYKNGERNQELQRIGDLKKDENGKYITGTRIEYHYDPTIFNDKVLNGYVENEVYSKQELEERFRYIILGSRSFNIEIYFKYKDDPVQLFSNKTIRIEDVFNPQETVYIKNASPSLKYEAETFIKLNPVDYDEDYYTVIINRLKMIESPSNAAIKRAIVSAIRELQKNNIELNRLYGNLRIGGEKSLKRYFTILHILDYKNARYTGQTKSTMSEASYVGDFERDLTIRLFSSPVFRDLIAIPILENLSQRAKDEERLKKIRKKEEEERKRRELLESKKSRVEELRNDRVKLELNKDNSNITIKESPRPVKDSTLIYVEGESAGAVFNDIHEDGEKPIAVALTQGKIPNVLDESNEGNTMISDNILYCLEAGYKDLAIFTDADADGNHIKLLHILTIWTYARKYLEEGRVFIIPAPYSSVTLVEPTGIQLYDEVKVYDPGIVYTYSAKEHQALVKSGASVNQTFRGLADSPVSIEKMVTDRSKWIRVKAPNIYDIEILTRLFTPGSDYKSNFTKNLYTERLFLKLQIQNNKNEIDLERNNLLVSFEKGLLTEEPKPVNYLDFLTYTGVADKDSIAVNITEKFKKTHSF